jgi:hypothetical protein
MALELVDTNIFIDHFRSFGPATRFLLSRSCSADIAFSAITETEVLAGKCAKDLRTREELLGFLSQWKKVPFDNPAASIAGDLVREHNLSVPDAIIAATAINENAVLLTQNLRHFIQVKSLNCRKPY